MELVESEFNKGTLTRMYSLKNEKVCARRIMVQTHGNIIIKAKIFGGCEGNATGLTSMLIGTEIDDAIARLSGIDCHDKGTSCPDCLARILKEIRGLSDEEAQKQII